MYNYDADLVRVVDGDTTYLTIDLGFHIKTTVSFRLLGINAPEMKGSTHDAGLAAKEHLASLLSKGKLNVVTSKPLSTDKYGRWLVKIFVTETNGNVIDVSNQMILDNHAVLYNP